VNKIRNSNTFSLILAQPVVICQGRPGTIRLRLRLAAFHSGKSIQSQLLYLPYVFKVSFAELTSGFKIGALPAADKRHLPGTFPDFTPGITATPTACLGAAE
jgi:hypothetical protein